MDFLEQPYHNDFLTKWIHGRLTAKERTMFVNSSLYKNLVFSRVFKRNTTKERV